MDIGQESIIAISKIQKIPRVLIPLVFMIETFTGYSPTSLKKVFLIKLPAACQLRLKRSFYFLVMIKISKIAALHFSYVIYGDKGGFINIINNFL